MSPTAINLDATGGATLSFWMRLDSDYVNAGNRWAFIQTGGSYNWLLSSWSSTEISFSFDGAATTSAAQLVASVIGPTGVWSHIVVTIDTSTKLLSAYKNGAVASFTNRSAYTGASAGYLKTSFKLGSGMGGELPIVQPTSFADVRLYDRVLTAGEISNIYNSTVGAPGFQVLGNVSTSNALVTTNVTAGTMNTTTTNTLVIYGTSGFMAVNAASASGTSLYVQGNIYASNTISSPNIVPLSINTTTTNTLAISGKTGFVGLGTTAPSGTSLYVSGNVYTSATLNVNTSVGGIAATTLNVLSISSYGPYINLAWFLDPTAWAQIPFSGSSLADAAGKGNLTSPVVTGTQTYTVSGGPDSKPSIRLETGSWVTYNASSTAINVDLTGATVGFWFRAESAIQTGINVLYQFSSTYTTYSLYFSLGPGGGQVYFSTSGGFINPSFSFTWAVGQWYHIAFILDPVTTFVNVYVNGALALTSTAWPGTAGYLKSTFILGTTVSGASRSLKQPTSFADVRVYNRALSAAEITAVYNSTVGAPGFQVLGNTAVTGTITYSEDLTKRSIHLRPSAANASTIQAWIGATCNAAGQPSKSYWATSPTPIYANAVSGSVSGYSGGVLVPDGRVVMVPNGIYNPTNSTLSEFSGTGVTRASFAGGVLMPNGNVLYVPQSSNIGEFDPTTGRYSNALSVPAGGYNGVLSSNGVVLTPTGAPSNIINYNYTARAYSNVLAIVSNPTPAQNWTTATTVVGTNWRAIEWSSQLGLFVSVGEASPYLAYSSDGRNWTAATTVVGTAWLGVGWSPQLGLFVATGYATPYLAYSTDGKNWVAATTVVGTFWWRVVWSPELALFVISGEASPYLAYSTDGKNWVAATTVVGTNWRGVAWSPRLGLFVVVSPLTTPTPYIATSPDGKNWTGCTITNGAWIAVAWSPELGIFAAVGAYGTGFSLAWSTNGTTWTYATGTGTASSWYGVAWSPQLGVFVAVGATSPYIVYSVDGKNWTAATTTLGTSWLGVAWSPQLGIFAIGGTATPYLAYTANVTPLRSGSLLLPSGAVAFGTPGTSNLMQFNPVALTSSNITIGTDGYSGLVLAPNGNIVAVPTTGNVVSISTSASNVGPVTGGGANVSSWFQGGALLPSGNIMFTPGTSANVGLFDPVAMTFSNSTQVGSNSFVKFSGSTLLPSGQVVLIPSGAANVGVLDTMTPALPEFCLSPYVNKF
jgi:hypothetical protein